MWVFGGYNILVTTSILKLTVSLFNTFFFCKIAWILWLVPFHTNLYTFGDWIKTIFAGLTINDRRHKLSTGVIISPQPGGPGRKFKNFFSKKSQCRKRVILAFPYLYTLQNLLAYTGTLPIIIFYPNTLPNTFGFGPEPKSCRQPIRIEHEEP